MKYSPILLESLQKKRSLWQTGVHRVEQQRLPSSSEAEAARGHQSFLLLPVSGKFSPQVFFIYILWWSLPLLQTSKQEMLPRTLYFPHLPAKSKPQSGRCHEGHEVMSKTRDRIGRVVLTTPNTSTLYNEKSRTLLSSCCREACRNLTLLGNSRSVPSSKNIVT